MSLRPVFFDVKTLSMTKMQVAGYRLAFIALALNMLTWLLPVLANSADGGFLSICTAKGIQVIKVTDNGFPDNAPEPLSDDNTRSQNCAFCFAQSATFTPVTGVSVYSPVLRLIGRPDMPGDKVWHISTPERDLDARAPPVFS